jgi:hypothetical protein
MSVTGEMINYATRNGSGTPFNIMQSRKEATLGKLPLDRLDKRGLVHVALNIIYQ